jgi:hypothetical protein
MKGKRKGKKTGKAAKKAKTGKAGKHEKNKKKAQPNPNVVPINMLPYEAEEPKHKGKRSFVWRKFHNFKEGPLLEAEYQLRFTVMSYNILAQEYCADNAQYASYAPRYSPAQLQCIAHTKRIQMGSDVGMATSNVECSVELLRA